MTPSLSAVLPNGPSYGFFSFFQLLFFFFFHVSLSSFLFHAAPAAQKLPRLSLASSDRTQQGGHAQGSHAGFVPADVCQDEGL